MKKKRLIFLWVLTTLLSIKAYGQTKDETAITIDVNARTMTLPPFDAKFRVNSFSTDFDKITFQYYLDDIIRLEKKRKVVQEAYISTRDEVIKNITGDIPQTPLDNLLDSDQGIELTSDIKRFIIAFKDNGGKKEQLIGLVYGTLKFKKNKFISTKEVDQFTVLLVYQFYQLLDVLQGNLENQISKLSELSEYALELESLDKRIKSLKKGGNYYFFGDEFELGVANGKAHFPKSIGPLHPEVSYTFQFEGTKKVKLEDKDLNSLKAETVRLLEKKFLLGSSPTNSDLEEFKSGVFKLMKDYSKSDKIFKGKDEIIYNPTTNPITESSLWPTIDEMYQEYDNITGAKSGIDKQTKALKKDFKNSRKVFNILNDLLLRKIQPSESLKENILSQSLNSSLERNKDLTFSQLLELMLSGDEGEFFKKILDGNSKIDGNNLAKTYEVDYESILLLKSFFDRLTRRSFRKKQKISKNKFEDVEIFNRDPELKQISQIVNHLDNLIVVIKVKNNSQEFIKKLNHPALAVQGGLVNCNRRRWLRISSTKF